MRDFMPGELNIVWRYDTLQKAKAASNKQLARYVEGFYVRKIEQQESV